MAYTGTAKRYPDPSTCTSTAYKTDHTYSTDTKFVKLPKASSALSNYSAATKFAVSNWASSWVHPPVANTATLVAQREKQKSRKAVVCIEKSYSSVHSYSGNVVGHGATAVANWVYNAAAPTPHGAGAS